jgi:hypothetical protein
MKSRIAATSSPTSRSAPPRSGRSRARSGMGAHDIERTINGQPADVRP